MPEADFKLEKYIWAILCFSIILLNGCQLQELNQAKFDDANIKEDKTKDIPPDEQEPGYLSEVPTAGMEIVDEEELEVLKKVRNLEIRLEALRNEMRIQAKESNKRLSDMQAAKEGVERDLADTKKKLEEKNEDMSGKTNALVTKLSDTEAGAVATEQGSGYLSERSSIKMGVIDGDEEINVLEKIRRLETRLEAERNKVKVFEEKLSKLQAAKEVIEKDFADTKKELEEENKSLLGKVTALGSKLSDTEAKVVATEKELVKTQLSDIKAQQELYKLKIDNMNQEEE